MEPVDLLTGGLAGVLATGLGIVWREWQIDRKKAEERFTAALSEQREDAKAMHQLAADLGQAANAVAQININGGKIDNLTRHMEEGVAILKLLKGAN